MDAILYVLAGPTASGKTETAIKVAKEFGSEIISADSRQFYKEMSIGTAKPEKNQLSEVKHHFVDFLSVTQDYNAGNYEKDVLTLLHKLFKNGQSVLLTGGSGLYINAVCYGLSNFPEVDRNLRDSLNQQFKEEGIEPLVEVLRQKDPEYAAVADLKNPQRVIRALEVCLTNQKPYSYFKKSEQSVSRPFKIKKAALLLKREELYKRINDRCLQMIESGLLEEVKKLYPLRGFNALKTVGYTEFFDWIEGKCSYDEAVSKFKQHSRNYAKRQMTWLKKDKTYEWFAPEDIEGIISYFRREV